MALVVIELGEATIANNWERIEFSVALPDMKQPIIMACKGGHYYDHTTNQWKTNTNKSKFRLTSLNYKLEEGVISLTTLRGNFFTKANRVGAREAWVGQLDKETIDQIPDELHDMAREHLNKELAPMLQKIIDTGLVVKASA